MRKNSINIVCLFAALALHAPGVANATTIYRMTEPQMVFTGTGFFVSRDGYAITNQHVVDGCSEVVLQGGVPQTRARVVAVDSTRDLALLKAPIKLKDSAPLRELNVSHLEMDEPVLLMGYPVESQQTGRYVIKTAQVVGLKGPLNQPEFIQISDSVQHGNSGGPLLDSAGNVAGVIVAKSTLISTDLRTGKEEVVARSDLAISLPVLIGFLDENRVNYRVNPGQGYMMEQRIEEDAREYIVNVICETPKLR